MKRVEYIGEKTGNNMQVTPDQLLDMIRDYIYDPKEKFPVMGLFAVVVREQPDGTLNLENFRCQLPKFVEVAIISRTWQKITGTVTKD